jgi:hypothetical protein
MHNEIDVAYGGMSRVLDRIDSLCIDIMPNVAGTQFASSIMVLDLS